MRVKRTIQITGEETKEETEQLNITSTKHTVSGSPYPKTKGTIKVEIEAQYIKNEERPETKAIPRQIRLAYGSFLPPLFYPLFA